MSKLNYLYENIERADFEKALAQDLNNMDCVHVIISSSKDFYERNKAKFDKFLDMSDEMDQSVVDFIMHDVERNLYVYANNDTGYVFASRLYAKTITENVRNNHHDVKPRQICFYIDVDQLEKISYLATGTSIGRGVGVTHAIYKPVYCNVSKDDLAILEANCTVIGA